MSPPQPPPLAHSILDVIGNTPLVELRRCVDPRRAGRRGRLLAKLETFNPGLEQEGPDRAGDHPRGAGRRHAPRGADGRRADQRQHRHRPGDRLPGAGTSVRRRDLAGQLGRAGPPDGRARGRGGRRRPGRRGRSPARSRATTWRGSRRRTAEVVAERGAFRVDQFGRAANVLAHERHTGPEIWEQSAGRVDVFVDLVGTGGSFTGVARALRTVQPRSCAPTWSSPRGRRSWRAGRSTDPRHKLQGAGYARRRPAPARPRRS